MRIINYKGNTLEEEKSEHEESVKNGSWWGDFSDTLLYRREIDWIKYNSNLMVPSILKYKLAIKAILYGWK